MKGNSNGLLMVALALAVMLAGAMTLLYYEVPHWHRPCDNVGYCPPR